MRKLLPVLLVFLSLHLSLFPLNPCRLGDIVPYMELGKPGADFEILIDSKGDLTLEQVRNMTFSTGPEDMNHLFQRGKVWLRFIIQSDLLQTAEIVIDSVETETDKIDFYLISESGESVHHLSGRMRSVDKYSLKGWKMAVPVLMEPGEKIEVYISFASGFLVRTPVRISTLSRFVSMNIVDTIITVLLLGGFLALFSNHLVLFMSTGNRLFLFSSLYILAICLYLAAIENLLHGYIFTGEGFISRVLLPRFNLVMPLLALVFLLNYQRSVLKLIKKTRILEQVMKYTSLVLLGYVVIQYFFPYLKPLYPLFLILYMGAILLVISPILYFRYLSENGRIFLISLIPLAVLIFLQQFQNLGVLNIDPISPFPVYTGETFFIGLFFQVLILSMLTSSLLRDKDRTEQQLEYEKTIAEKNYRVKNRMIQNMSHEIKSNLNLMNSTLYKLNSSQGDIQKDFQRYIKNITTYIKKAVNEEMDENRNDIIEQIQIVDLLEEIRKDFLPLAEKKKQKIQLSGSKSLFPLYSNVFMVQTIVRNLLDNAIKYGPEKSMILLELESSEDEISISVSDQGEGIPEEEQSNIFNRAYRMEHHLEKGIDGMGLGLHISKDMATTLGGELNYHLNAEKGSIFSLVLNAYNGVPIPQSFLNNPVFDYIRIESEKPLILIVEDNWEMMSSLINLLENDYQIKGALEGGKALQALSCFKPDLIISDIMMPGIDGFTFLNEYLRLYGQNTVPFLFLTAAEMVESRIRGLSLGAIDYIEKPFQVEEILLRIRNLLILKDQTENSLLNELEEYVSIKPLVEQKHNTLESRMQQYNLTKRERELLYLLIKRMDEEQIREIMGISKHTLNTHKYSIFRKTESSNKIELLRLFLME